MITKLYIAITLTFLAALLVACGSTSKTGPNGNSSGPLTKAAFVEQGNAICTKAAEQRRRDLQAAIAKDAEAGRGEDLHSFVDLALESVKEMAIGLGELEPPRAQREKVKALVDDLRKEVEYLTKNPNKVASGLSFKSANAAARQVSLRDCQI